MLQLVRHIKGITCLVHSYEESASIYIPVGSVGKAQKWKCKANTSYLTTVKECMFVDSNT